MAVYGKAIERSEYRQLHSIIGEVEVSAAGNIILRVGREVAPDNGWTQTEHVVLTPDEALALAAEINLRAGRKCPSGAPLDVLVRGHHCDEPHD